MRRILFFSWLSLVITTDGECRHPLFASDSEKCRIQCGTKLCGSSEAEFHNCLRSCGLTPIMKKCIAEGLRKGYSIPPDVLHKFQKYLDYLSSLAAEKKMAEVKESMLSGSINAERIPEKPALSTPNGPEGRMDLAPRSAPKQSKPSKNGLGQEIEEKFKNRLYVVPFGEELVKEPHIQTRQKRATPTPPSSEILEKKEPSASMRVAPHSDNPMAEEDK